MGHTDRDSKRRRYGPTTEQPDFQQPQEAAHIPGSVSTGLSCTQLVTIKCIMTSSFYSSIEGLKILIDI